MTSFVCDGCAWHATPDDPFCSTPTPPFACDHVDGKTYRMVDEIDNCVNTPLGALPCRFSISFDDGSYNWSREDYADLGSYWCTDGGTIELSGVLGSAQAFLSSGHLVLDGRAYIEVPPTP
jgi:hypothetical protein